jgi:hypothetical protein
MRGLVSAAFFALAQPLAAQVALAGHAGTLGLGASVAYGTGGPFAVRGGVNLFLWEPSHDFDDAEFTVDVGSPSWMGVIDFYPGAGALRLTGGVVWFGATHEVRARLNEDIELGDDTYTPQQLGTLTGELRTRDVAPYVGVGFGRKPGTTHGPGFLMDLGVAVHGKPDVRLKSTGPLANDLNPFTRTAFNANLVSEQDEIEDDIQWFRFYPVLSIGLTFGF